MSHRSILGQFAQAGGHTFIRFMGVGLLNTSFSFSAYAISTYCGAPTSLAVLIANILGVSFSFRTTSRFVFRKMDHRLIPRFITVYSLLYFLGVAGIKVLLSWRINRYLAGAMMAIPTAMASFLMLSLFVFRNREE